MATFKVKFCSEKCTGKAGRIYFQVIHERKIRWLTTEYEIFPDEWDSRNSRLIMNCRNERSQLLLQYKEQIYSDARRLKRIICVLEQQSVPYSVDDVVDMYRSFTQDYSLSCYMNKIILQLKHNDKIRTAETYTATLRSFLNYRCNKDIMLDDITSHMMEEYESWCRQRGLTMNTISFYMRILRAVYNRAIDSEIIENSYPFKHVYTGIDKTRKRAIPIRILKKIKSLDLSRKPQLDYARDMFMLSFYFRGMSFIDMAYLRKSDLKNNHITYRRRKTGQLLTIGWTREMQMILDKYPKNNTEYLLPIIRKSGINERNVYRNTSYNINRHLKIIAEMLSIDTRLTLYVARHSWASVAKAKGIPLSVISEGMGHDSETTTKIYLASLDTTIVDKANSIILSAL
ncbi:MAG: site-specific integrase [Muribaculum sp.]|nr:site-specific integrase [Muribaculum sp.]